MLQALAEKEADLVRLEAALVRQEAALVRQEEDGLNNSVRLMVQSPVLQALKEDSRAMRQVISYSMNSATLMMQYKLVVPPQTVHTPQSHS